jgi:hypothetical protein
MSSEHLPAGPDRDAMIRLIRETWPDAVVATIESATFFSLDEKHWPNFATVVWTDEHDEGAPSNLSRPGAYRKRRWNYCLDNRLQTRSRRSPG